MAHQDEPFDAYELGRAAAATLQETNSQLSYELPSALQTLFSNEEFQEAMVVAGVSSDRIVNIPQQSPRSSRYLTTHSDSTTSYITSVGPDEDVPSESEPGSPLLSAPLPPTSTRMTRREQLALRSIQQEEVDRSGQKLQGQQTIIPLPKIPTPKKTLLSGNRISRVEGQRSSGSSECYPRLVGVKIEETNTILQTVEDTPIVQEIIMLEAEVEGESSLCETTISEEDVSVLGIPHYEDEAKSTNNLCSTAPPEQPDVTFPHQPCLTCGESEPSSRNYTDNAEDLRRMKKCREMMWILLGMDRKQFDRDEETSPFCNECLHKAEKCYWMSLQILGIQQSYDEICESLQLGLINGIVSKTKAAQSCDSELKLERLKKGILQKLRSCHGPVLIPNENLHLKTVGEIMLEFESERRNEITDRTGDEDEENEEIIIESAINKDLRKSNKTPVKGKKRKKVEGSEESELANSSEEEEGQRLSAADIKSMRECGFNKSDLEEILKGKILSKSRNSKNALVVFRCPKCPDGFEDKDSLKMHLQAHWNLETAQYKCFVCDEKFESLVEIRKHKSSHRQEITFECSYCDKVFGSERKRKEHESIHFVPTATCEICSKKITDKSLLKKHMWRHNYHRSIGGEFDCQFCTKKLATKANLEEHLRRHKGIKPFQCDLCQEKFHRRRNFKLHFKKHHPTENPDANFKKLN